jgi:hypothetical protein
VNISISWFGQNQTILTLIIIKPTFIIKQLVICEISYFLKYCQLNFIKIDFD